MRFEIPQYIEIEDKIFGPFTWRQFIYLIGGGLFAVALYLLSLPFIITIIIGLPVVGLAAALAFYPINNRPFSLFLESVITYFTKHHLYIWRRSAQTSAEETEVEKSAPQSEVDVGSSLSGGISNLSHQLEISSLEEVLVDER